MRTLTRTTKVAGLCALMIAVSAAVHPKPRLIWNPTASVPVGLYWRSDAAVTRGDLVLAVPPSQVEVLAATRHYLPAGVPVIKRIAGEDGDEICVREHTIFINKEAVAVQLEKDSKGRPMPLWTGCRRLTGEVFLLLADVPASFDSRYFGPVVRSAVLGKAIPLWTR